LLFGCFYARYGPDVFGRGGGVSSKRTMLDGERGGGGGVDTPLPPSPD